MTKTWFGESSGRAVTAIAIAIALALAACGGDDGPEPSASSGGVPADECTADSRAGTTLTIAEPAQANGFDTVVSGNTGASGGTSQLAVYDALMRWDSEAGTYDPWVAESLEPNDDFTEWTLTLRDGVTFGDGSPLTGDAVAAHLERFVTDPDSVRFRSVVGEAIEEAEVLDPLTVHFTLKKSYARFPWLLSGRAGMIVNPAALEELGREGLEQVGAGVGPYEVVTFALDEEIVLEAREDYWGDAVCIEQIRIVPVPLDATRFDGLRSGSFDLIYVADPEVTRRALDEGYESVSTLTNMGYSFTINHGVGGERPTSDVRVRRALAYAFDVATANESQWGEAATPQSALLSEDSIFYPDDSELTGPRQDPAQAAALVAEVKEEGAWDGSLSFVCSPEREELALAAQAMWEAAGFEVSLDILPTNQMVSRVADQHDFDISCWGGNVSDEEISFRNQTSTEAQARGYANPEWDRLQAELEATRDADRITEIVLELQEIWNSDIPALSTSSVHVHFIHGDNVTGVEHTVERLPVLNNVRIEG